VPADVLVSTDKKTNGNPQAGILTFCVDTIPVPHSFNPYIHIKVSNNLATVGATSSDMQLWASIWVRKIMPARYWWQLKNSRNAAFCAEHNICSDVALD